MIEIRYVEIQERNNRVRLELQYRWENVNVLGVPISWSDWQKVERVKLSGDDHATKTDDKAE